ncbi:protein-(glutamine-N5) methyltransferase, ribosomal protein L3-specific [Luminiphilus syltensis NOR5-1B]|uniref:Protein-(Glutamine-N5) methyltransferase, ribosomal protein L3-specific n=1 Tax=Luminiphilus syltensis NOR5-1B TaxID=565045 RepID=B8KRR4_9GAMM|nr:50S ribosomal protein L3 N(5)-glutamine methyltransferase [Luminiphilus syltensis]EED34790.1 protein-(glutamine-N5) methyltransferase, ribosomal protein L3-specific [Luminiphilus syltensis NOR5-1B]
MSQFHDIIKSTESRLAKAGVYCGHGYDSHHDEAVALVLAAAGLPMDTGQDVLNTSYPRPADLRLTDFVQQRIEGRKPVAYIIGQAWLGHLSFHCDERALVPRSPLMGLVYERFSPWWVGGVPERIVDVCCGGGSLGILAATEFPGAEVLCLDIDEKALALAEENIARHGLQGQISTVRADLLGPLSPDSVDIILANPPYVDAQDMADLPAEYSWEPRLALEAGDDGLDLVHRLLVQAASRLRESGYLFLEVGNSWPAMERAFPRFEFLWLEPEWGGHGITALSHFDLITLLDSGGYNLARS